MDKLLILALLSQVGLTLALYISMNIAKGRASKNGEVDESRRMLSADAWPPKVQQINNCLGNQFEAPVLLYLLGCLLLMQQQVDAVAVGLSWLFVFSRIGHAIVHTGVNTQPWRKRWFVLGTLSLIALWMHSSYLLLR